MTEPVSRDLTRRQALSLGTAAALAAMFGRITTASAAIGNTDPYLSRASYVPLVGQPFTVAASSVVLLAVSDLDHLAGRDDAFRLDFAGDPGIVDGGIQRFGHKALGAFDLFVTPVGAVDNGVQHYEVVIDRSVPLPRDPAVAGKPDPAAASGPATKGDTPTAAAPGSGARGPSAPAQTSVIHHKRRGKIHRVVKKSKAKARARARRAAVARRRRLRLSRPRR